MSRPDDLTVLRHRELRLDTTRRCCIVDGVVLRASIGHWMFYLPETREKFFHAKNRATDCIHPTRPVDHMLDKNWTTATYTSADWRRALTTPLERRMAELWVAGERLAAAGLGPKPLGLTFAASFVRDGVELGPTRGIVFENVEELPSKPACRDEDMIAAGVLPDRIRSAIRQQLNGYVVDLSSVVGVQPIDGERDVRRVLEWIEAA